MPVPYRRTPRAAEIGLAAFLDVLSIPSERALYGGLLVLDGKGQPQEFVHNTLTVPAGGFLLDSGIPAVGTAMLAHSLFDACRKDPDLLVCLSSLGSPEFCKTEIAPAVPFAMVVPAQEETPAEWSWVNDPPSSGMRASILAQELARRGLIVEPFERLRHALRLVYPQAAWEEVEEE